MIRIPTILGIGLGFATLAAVLRSSPPKAASGRRAVWRSPIPTEGSFWYAEPGWIGFWTTISDGEIVNETSPPF